MSLNDHGLDQFIAVRLRGRGALNASSAPQDAPATESMPAADRSVP
jgi:hypothetical protein